MQNATTYGIHCGVTWSETPSEERAVYKAKRTTWTVEGREVSVTYDTASGIVTGELFSYRDHESACDKAWKMATRAAAVIVAVLP